MSDGTDPQVLRAAIEAQEQLRGTIPDAVVDATIGALREQLAALGREPRPKRRRLATILFADMSGSTELGETIDAEELSDRFDQLWSRIDAIIDGHGGTIDKHIGDAVMAVWGADGSSESDPERAVRAALEMLAAVAELEGRGVLPGTSMRIGINTGSVVVGPVAGTAEWTVMGDTVNTAARIESAAPAGSLLIGHDTYRHVRGVFSVALRDPISVKGKRDLLRTYLVEDVRPRAFRMHARTIEGVETPMVGRTAEFAALRSALERVVERGAPEMTTIVGEAGMGKSRLLFEFEDWLRTRPGEVRRFSGRTDPDRCLTPYWLLRDIVFDRFEIGDDEPAAIARAKVEVGVEQIAGGGLDPEIELICRFVGVGEDDADIGETGPEQAARAIATVLTRTAARMPVVIIIEDFHWADPTSARLIGHLRTELTSGAVHIVLTGRRSTEPGEHPVPASEVALELDPLADDDIRGLVLELLHRADPVPEPLVARIVAVAGGNPFYVEELVRMLIDEGVVAVDDEQWRIDLEHVEELRIPSTLRGVLQARFDRLPSEEFALLQRAAVAGETFWASAIPDDEHSSLSPAATQPLLDRLIARGLLQPVVSGEPSADTEHRFAHALLHGAVYESVLLAERRRLHTEVAEWMAERSDVAAASIADHYRSGDQLQEAAEWFAVAVERARARAAAHEGVLAAQAALELDRLDRRRTAEVLAGLISCLSIEGHHDEALPLTDRLETLGTELDDAAIVALARSKRSFLLGRLGRTREGLEAARAAHRAVGELPPDDDAVIDALSEVGWALARLGHIEEAIACADDALARLGPRTDLGVKRQVLSLAGSAALAGGRHLDAERHLEAALDVARALGDPRNEAAGVINLSELARLRGDLARSIEMSRHALDLVRSIRDRDQEALVLSNLGGALAEHGEAEAARPLLEEALELFDANGASEHTSETHRFLAEVWMALGDNDEARRSARRALVLAEADESADHLGHAWRVLGLLCDTTGEPEPDGDDVLDAEACLRRAVDCFAATEMPRDRAFTLLALADVIGRGSAADAAHLRAEAAALVDQLDLPAGARPSATST